MQDIHAIAGGSRLFGGGGDRRLRPHLHHHQSHQALKCPRCDSLNTKFCYYNNYNLSQPRHFCKSCRRYWTKGGVLRNVPVGGGCRKAKRSSKSKSTPIGDRKSSSNSSSESSSLTAATTAPATETALSPETAGGNFEAGPPVTEHAPESGIFTEIGSFTSLITAPSETVPFGFGNISETTPFPFNQQVNQLGQFQRVMNVSEEPRMQEMGGGYVNQTAQVDPGRTSNVGFGSLDWQTSGDHQGLFDLSSAVDQAYWSQSQWSDQDPPNLFLP